MSDKSAGQFDRILGDVQHAELVLVTTDRDAISPALIVEQREKGWPDLHPEDYCHQCGGPNVCWWVSGPEWERATASLERGVLTVLCPQCFVAAWERAAGTTSCWELRPSVATLTRLVGGDPDGG